MQYRQSLINSLRSKVESCQRLHKEFIEADKQASIYEDQLKQLSSDTDSIEQLTQDRNRAELQRFVSF